ncbi:MAG: prephenate dehydrogenase [Chloroflexi bacterium]|nr:prephenate dehydrogenase [Chloroflexota bacterium]
MAIQLTLIGLGRIGTSLGLALKRRAAPGQLFIVGHDRELQNAKMAQAKGAVDRAEWNLPAACENADAIFLCVPLSALRQALEEVAPNAKPGCVITDTAPLKAPVLEWAAALTPADRYFVGGSPILNPIYLHESATGLDAARADLFEGGLWALAPQAEAAPEALKLVADVAKLIGATPFFVGAVEHDALMAGTHTLPALASAALMKVVAASPDWADARKLADRTFATATAPVSFSSPAAARAAALLNQTATLRALDSMIGQLTALRGAVAAGDEAAMDALLTEVAILREAWLAKRREANWEADELPKTEMPTPGQLLRQLVGLGKRK